MMACAVRRSRHTIALPHPGAPVSSLRTIHSRRSGRMHEPSRLRATPMCGQGRERCRVSRPGFVPSPLLDARRARYRIHGRPGSPNSATMCVWLPKKGHGWRRCSPRAGGGCSSDGRPNRTPSVRRCAAMLPCCSRTGQEGLARRPCWTCARTSPAVRAGRPASGRQRRRTVATRCAGSTRPRSAAGLRVADRPHERLASLDQWVRPRCSDCRSAPTNGTSNARSNALPMICGNAATT